MKKVIKAISIMITIIIILFGASFGINKFYRYKLTNAENEKINALAGGLIFNTSKEKLYKELASQESDIKGMTKLDKINAGYYPDDNSDSDFDGLTDKEELEKYNSDPLNPSTANDLYYDGYKVKNNMDIQTYYEYDKEAIVYGGKENELSINILSPYDSDVTINSYKGDKINNQNAIYTYQLKNYCNNEITIDLNKTLKICETNISPNKIQFFTKNSSLSSELIKCDSKISKGIATITLPESKNLKVPYDIYTDIYLIQKPSFTAKFLANADETVDNTKKLISDLTGLDDSDSDKYCSLITICPIYSCIGETTPPTVYIADDITDEQLNDTLEMQKIIYQHYIYTNYPEVRKKIKEFQPDKRKCIVVSRENIKWRTDILEKVMPSQKTYGDGVENDLFYLYAPYDYYKPVLEAERIKKAEEERRWKNVTDKFRFSNFSSDWLMEKHGNCAGFASIACIVHDKGSLGTLKGEYTSTNICEGKSIAYDCSDDWSATTLLDRGISDFRPSYTDSMFEDYNAMDENDIEFTKMMEAYWAKTNDIVNEDLLACTFFTSRNEYVKWSVIEKVIELLDNNQTVICGFSVNNELSGGHSVLLTSYEKIDTTGTVNEDFLYYRFRAYDSNYPNDDLYIDIMSINNNGKPVSFVYNIEKYNCIYNGVEDSDLDNNILYAMSFMDADFNLINNCE